jgi:uncharacterized protein YlxW (UPF0749 family)
VPRETLSTRIARLENIAIAHDASIEALIESQRQTQEQFRLTEEQFRRTDQILADFRRESDARERHMDERVEKLVSAIGELIRRNGVK